MNNIYVDELPKDCLDCPCESESYCNLLYDYIPCIQTECRHPECPLKSLTDRLAEERKRVVQEIRKKAKKTQFYIEPTEKSPTGKQKGFIYEFSDRLLDQIERGV